jgi:iron complex transport system ATP-binding protein
MQNLLHIKNLSVGFKKVLINQFNLEVNPAEMVAIVGRNGTGKTTLLKTIAGLVKPIAGEIILRGKNLNHLLPAEKATLVSIVLTHKIPLQGINVKTLVGMGRYPVQGRFHFGNEHDQEQVASQLAKLHITHLAEKPLAEISDGEMQKVMIARTLAQQTPLLLMDEPTAFLDYIAKEELFATLKRLSQEEKIAILFSSHDMELVKKYADRIVEIS